MKSKCKHPAGPREPALAVASSPSPRRCLAAAADEAKAAGALAARLPSPCLPLQGRRGGTGIRSSDSTESAAYASGKWPQLTAWSNRPKEIHSLPGCPQRWGGNRRQREGQAARLLQRPRQKSIGSRPDPAGRTRMTHIVGKSAFCKREGFPRRELSSVKTHQRQWRSSACVAGSRGDQQPPRPSAGSPRPCRDLCQK